jgi:hypothetical protein
MDGQISNEILTVAKFYTVPDLYSLTHCSYYLAPKLLVKLVRPVARCPDHAGTARCDTREAGIIDWPTILARRGIDV